MHEKTKSPFNIILLNLTLVNLLISSVGIFLDMVGTSLRGRILAEGFCEFEGFFYMFIGQYTAKLIAIQGTRRSFHELNIEIC